MRVRLFSLHILCWPCQLFLSVHWEVPRPIAFVYVFLAKRILRRIHRWTQSRLFSASWIVWLALVSAASSLLTCSGQMQHLGTVCHTSRVPYYHWRPKDLQTI